VTSTLIIPARFNGPPTSGNGGVSAGRVAALVSATEPVEVSLRSPVPLDELMRASTSDGVTSVYAGELLVAEARVVDSSALGQAVAPVDFTATRIRPASSAERAAPRAMASRSTPVR
jgi:hypothetical protein